MGTFICPYCEHTRWNSGIEKSDLYSLYSKEKMYCKKCGAAFSPSDFKRFVHEIDITDSRNDANLLFKNQFSKDIEKIEKAVRVAIMDESNNKQSMDGFDPPWLSAFAKKVKEFNTSRQVKQSPPEITISKKEPDQEPTKEDPVKSEKHLKEFYLVWSPFGRTPPKYKHKTRDSAHKEAARLAKLHNDNSFYVLVVLERCIVPSCMIQWQTTELVDDIPF